MLSKKKREKLCSLLLRRKKENIFFILMMLLHGKIKKKAPLITCIASPISFWPAPSRLWNFSARGPKEHGVMPGSDRMRVALLIACRYQLSRPIKGDKRSVQGLGFRV